MDGQRFDSLTRSFAVTSSRRQVVKGLAGGALAGALALLGVGSAGARRCRRPGQNCRSHVECCTQFCDPATFQCAPAPPPPPPVCAEPCQGANAANCCADDDEICCTATTGPTFGEPQCVTPFCSGGLVFNADTCSCGCPAGTGTCPGSGPTCCAACCPVTGLGPTCCAPGSGGCCETRFSGVPGSTVCCPAGTRCLTSGSTTSCVF